MTVESPQAGVTQSETFQVTEGGGNVTTTATAGGNVTATIPAGTTVATATANATATPTAAPGFGTLVALAGLAGVALLVAGRRD